MTHTLRLYSPAIVLAVWAVLAAVGVGLTAAGLAILAITVFMHIRAEVRRDA